VFVGIVSAGNVNKELSEEGKSRFAEPNLWVGTGEDIVSGTSKSAKLIAEYYRPRLYLGPLSDQCPDEVYYRVIKGIDIWAKSDAYLIQYFAYWDVQIAPYHKYDYEPIFIYVRNIGEKPYRVAYDRCDAFGPHKGKHIHEIHRTYSCIDPENGLHDKETHTNDKAYYPYGKRHYSAKVNLSDISTSLKDNWAGNQVKLGIANLWHTFDTDISDIECPYCELEPLTDAVLITAYREQLTEEGNVEAFKYDISDPFKGVFWEDHYHRIPKPIFPTISGSPLLFR
jgi:hypothetical protein